jgi:uncharacterized membrane protein YjjP (DUF1212 family)
MILIRVGMVFIVCGVLVGLVFSKWGTILPTGILLLISELVRRLIENHYTKTNIKPDAITILRPNQEEI